MLRYVFGFAELQDEATDYLTDKLPATRNQVKAVKTRAALTTNAQTVTSSNFWYAANYTPNVEQQAIITKQVLGRIATELNYV